MRANGPCPALEWSEADARYYCGLLTNATKHLGWIAGAGKQLTTRLLSRWIAAGKDLLEPMAAVKRFADQGGPVFGTCNGFQVLCETGLLPGALDDYEIVK